MKINAKDSELDVAAKAWARQCWGGGLGDEQERAGTYSDFIAGANWMRKCLENWKDKISFLTDERFRGVEQACEFLEDLCKEAE